MVRSLPTFYVFSTAAILATGCGPPAAVVQTETLSPPPAEVVTSTALETRESFMSRCSAVPNVGNPVGPATVECEQQWNGILGAAVAESILGILPTQAV